jgi:hypothetical protein
MNGVRNEYKIFVQRPRHGQEHNVRMDLREIGWEGVDWNTVTNL